MHSRHSTGNTYRTCINSSLENPYIIPSTIPLNPLSHLSSFFFLVNLEILSVLKNPLFISFEFLPLLLREFYMRNSYANFFERCFGNSIENSYGECFGNYFESFIDIFFGDFIGNCCGNCFRLLRKFRQRFLWKPLQQYLRKCP